MRNIFSGLAIAMTLFIFTAYIDGDIGVILTAFILFAPLTSLFFGWYGKKRIKVSFDCDGYVQKGSQLTVHVTVEKTGFFPLGIVRIETYASEVFIGSGKAFKLSLIAADKKTFSYTLDTAAGGNGEVALKAVYSCGFLDFVRFKTESALPAPKSVGVIPEIPQIKSSSKLFRSIADSVLTSDDEESSDSAILFSSNTAPGYEHREYEPGDPLKRVNWKLSAKKSQLMVRLDEAVASVQPLVVLDLYRSSQQKPIDALIGDAIISEERLIVSVFGLLSLLVSQGIASTFVYYGANGEVVTESVDNPEYPPQLLLKVLATKVIPDRRIKLMERSACACVIASTDCGEDIEALVNTFEDKDSISLIGVSGESRNLTDVPMWYLDGDNNFKLV